MQYYYSHNGTDQLGPFSIDDLRSKGLTPQTLIWHEGLPGWKPAGEVAELASLFRAASPSQTPGHQPYAASPAQQQSQYQPQYQSYPAQPQPPSYGQSGQVGYQAYNPHSGNNGMAVASLVMGIIGIVSFCLWIFPILAIIFGHIARGQISRGQCTGAGIAVAGLIMGYIALSLAVGATILNIVVAAANA